MGYRDFDDDGLKMPAGLKKTDRLNSRPATANSGKTGNKNKTTYSSGYVRTAAENYSASNKSAGSSVNSRTATSAKSNGSQSIGRQRRLFRTLIAALCVLVAGIIAIGVYFVMRWKNDDYSSLQSASLVVLAPDAKQADLSAQDAENATVPASTSLDNTSIVYNGQSYVKKKNVVNLLFLGIDTNAARKAKMQGYRSDMLMVCAVDIDARKATLISIPRDTYTTVYKVDENTGEVNETLQDKINSAYSYGGGATHYSYANAMACVQMFLERRCQLQQPLDFQLDVPVYLYAGIDMDGIPQVASAVGGVEVTLTESVPEVGSKGQTVTLKYQNAVEFLTNRHDTDGDTHRAARQQQFMVALAKKIKDMGPADMILSLYDELQKYVWTNLNTDQMIDFAKILTKVNIDSIEMNMITGEGRKIDGSYCMLHDEDATLQLLLDVYYTKAS